MDAKLLLLLSPAIDPSPSNTAVVGCLHCCAWSCGPCASSRGIAPDRRLRGGAQAFVLVLLVLDVLINIHHKGTVI